MLFIEYPKCSTCKKAKKYLDELNIEYIDRDIKNEKPTKNELKEWVELSKVDINKFFNTSGIKYRELMLKDKIKVLNDDEKLEILSSDGMLIKRPILVTYDTVLLGFKIDEWNKTLLEKGNK